MTDRLVATLDALEVGLRDEALKAHLAGDAQTAKLLYAMLTPLAAALNTAEDYPSWWRRALGWVRRGESSHAW